MRTTPLLAAIVLAAAIAGCARPLPAQLPPGPGLGQDGSGLTGGGDYGSAGPGSQADFVASVTSDTIYFDTDRFNIDRMAMAALQSQAQWLARWPERRITLEGHADERGTRDYNLALGERRANAAKNALITLGIAPARIATVSYGKERPVALGSDEASWARNRRAVTVTVR